MQQVMLLAALSFLVVLVASVGGYRNSGFELSAGGRLSTAPVLLATLNIFPIVVTIVTSFWVLRSDNCPTALYSGAPSVVCDVVGILLDVVGLMSARLARFDLGLSFLLATRGDSGWLFR